MAHEMNPNKPGVMIYFNQFRGLTQFMTKGQKADLVDALVDFAELGKLPDFHGDTVLSTAFYGAIRLNAEEDDRRFTKKSNGRKWANYVRWSEKYRAYLPEREEWEEAGRPNFLDIKRKLIQMDSSGATWNRMDVFYSIWNTITETNPQAQTPPQTGTGTRAGTKETTPDGGADAGSAAERPAAAFGPLPPALDAALTKWVMHREQITGRTLPQSSRGALKEDFRNYADEYGAEAVVKLVDVAVSSGWKIIPWDRLERERTEGAGQSAVSDLQAIYEEFGREETP